MMKVKAQKIPVSLPVNAIAEDRQLFEPFLSYELPGLKVRNFKEAFVTSCGLVCTNKGIIKECYHHTMKYQYEVCLRDASKYYHAASENPENLHVFDDEETYLVAHHPWHKNYYHWVNETIFRLWMVKDKVAEMILLLPPKDLLPAFAMESLKIFQFKSIFHIPFETSVLVRNLCMPELKPTMASYSAHGLSGMSNLFKHYVNSLNKPPVNVGEKIYLSRKKSRRRKIINEDEVIDLVRQHDFKVVYNEDYSFFEQVSLYANAKYLISIHGAGMTDMLFMKEGSTIFELYKRKTNEEDKHNFVFWYMADGLGYTYYQQHCEPVDPEEHYFTADIVVDIALFRENLELMSQNSSYPCLV